MKKKVGVLLFVSLLPFLSKPSFADEKELKALIAIQQAQISELLRAVQPIGSVIHSFLTEEQFNKQTSGNWVLADGRSVAGSEYSRITGRSHVPDLRGRFLRSTGGAAGALGEAQESAFQSHYHGFDLSHGHEHNITLSGDTAAKNGHYHEAGNLAALIGSVDNNTSSLGFVSTQNNLSQAATYSVLGSGVYTGVKSHRNHNTDVEGTTAANSHAASQYLTGGVTHISLSRNTAAAGAAETRPANVAVNIYVRVN